MIGAACRNASLGFCFYVFCGVLKKPRLKKVLNFRKGEFTFGCRGLMSQRRCNDRRRVPQRVFFFAQHTSHINSAPHPSHINSLKKPRPHTHSESASRIWPKILFSAMTTYLSKVFLTLVQPNDFIVWE